MVHTRVCTHAHTHTHTHLHVNSNPDLSSVPLQHPELRGRGYFLTDPPQPDGAVVVVEAAEVSQSMDLSTVLPARVVGLPRGPVGSGPGQEDSTGNIVPLGLTPYSRPGGSPTA